MIKLFAFVLIVIFFNACGVDTSSSDKDGGIPTSNDNTNEPTDLIDPNPIDTGDDTDTPGNGDGNNPGDNTNIENSIFDTSNAIYDANACDGSSYRMKRDSTVVGESTVGENGANFAIVDGHGLEIASRHSEGSLSTRDKTWVTLFYKLYPETSALGQTYASFTESGVFSINYDTAWNDSSVSNINNIVYVRSDNYDNSEDSLEKPSCYRAALNSDVGSEIDVKKVYR